MTLQQAAYALLKSWDSPTITPTAPYIAELRKALADEQAQAVEPTITTKTEQVAGAISKHISTPLVQREVLAAAQYIVHRYIPAQPVQQVAVPLTPMTPERAAFFMRRFKIEEKLLGPNEQKAIDYVLAMLEADVSFINEGNKAQQVAVPPDYALVPVEPTPEMIAAARGLVAHDTAYEGYRSVYKAMLAAAQGAKP